MITSIETRVSSESPYRLGLWSAVVSYKDSPLLHYDPEKLHLPKDSETYPIAPFIRHNEDDTTEADIDEISRLANEWMFVG